MANKATKSLGRIKNLWLAKKPDFSQWQSLDSMQKGVIVVLAFVAVGLTGTFISRAAQITDEETVRLSNGKEIRLGQSAQSVKQTLGDDLFLLSPRQYEYPGNGNQPIEVVMDIEKDRVVVIHLVSNQANIVKSSGNTVGLNPSQAASNDRRARPANGQIALLRKNALTIEQSRSTQFLLPDPCASDDRLGLVSLAQKGHIARVAEDLGGPGCYKGEHKND